MADPGIDKGGGAADFFKNLYTPQPASYVLEAPPPLRNKIKSEASNEVFWIIFRPVYFLPIHVTKRHLVLSDYT